MQRRPELIDVFKLVTDLAKSCVTETPEYRTVLDIIASQPRVRVRGKCFECDEYDPEGGLGYCYRFGKWKMPCDSCDRWREREYD